MIRTSARKAALALGPEGPRKGTYTLNKFLAPVQTSGDEKQSGKWCAGKNKRKKVGMIVKY